MIFLKWFSTSVSSTSLRIGVLECISLHWLRMESTRQALAHSSLFFSSRKPKSSNDFMEFCWHKTQICNAELDRILQQITPWQCFFKFLFFFFLKISDLLFYLKVKETNKYYIPFSFSFQNMKKKKKKKVDYWNYMDPSFLQGFLSSRVFQTDSCRCQNLLCCSSGLW